jgi:hypothetical protein
MLVGGRGNRALHAKYCSRRCLALARIRQTEIRELDPLDCAYIAGMFDGGGSVILWDRGYGGRPQLRATVSNTYFPVLEWIQNATGTGSIVRHAHPAETGYKDSGTWQCYGQNAVNLLEQMLPHLIIKREKALEAIASQQITTVEGAR